MREHIYISWLNYLGGFEYFLFTAEKEFDVDIEETGEVTINTFPAWPDSYGENADTIKKQVFRNTRNRIVVRSQHLSDGQVQALAFIRTSPLVQIIASRTDRRTVLVDTDSFRKYDEGEKLFTMEFSVSYTDPIQSQTV